MNLPISRYQQRRQHLQNELSEHSVVVLRAGGLCTRNNDCEYEFRPHSSFFYLTGYNEPDAYLVLTKTQSILFNLSKDPEKEQWTGFRYGIQGAIDNFGMDLAFSLDELEPQIISILDGSGAVYSLFEDNILQNQLLVWQQTLINRKRQGAKAPDVFFDVTTKISEMRLIKDSDEIAIMERAAQISVQAHTNAMKAAKSASYEYELEAEINYTFMKSGARAPAYTNIVAAGNNACTLHYIQNNAHIKDGDLVLIDAGCELGCYAADITTTFPTNGKFSEPQAALYNLVLDAQKAAISAIKINAPYVDFHNAAVAVLTKGLIALGLLSGELDSLIESKAYRVFYMHNTGHWLGLDVHDAGEYNLEGESRVLQAGMVVTVEPGLYVAKDNLDVHEKWRGIGIRIEDDVLVTADGPYVLTHGLVREIEDIEALINGV